MNLSKVMEIEYDFEKETGLKNPVFTKGAKFEKRPDGAYKIVKEATYTQEEVDKYIRARDEYIARRLFYEVGYDDFEERIKGYCNDLKDLDEFVPCESADSQCRMDCKYFGKNNCL